jgi:uncharacterized FAD-dependent dehydrogenase
LMITVHPQDFGNPDLFAGIRLQEIYERKAFEVGRGDYFCPIQRVADFLTRRAGKGPPPPSSYSRGLVATADIAELIPPVILQALYHGLPILNHRWQGQFLRDATLVGPEARGSSPVRMVRRHSSQPGNRRSLSGRRRGRLRGRHSQRRGRRSAHR